MTNDNASLRPGEIKISSLDPRHHTEFLLLSNSVNTWKTHVHDRSWWLTQENHCLEIFKRYGYDLQSGVWYCLISCQRHGWAGIASATLLLAEGFSKKQRQCWPPIAASNLRQQIIEWYCSQAATCIYGLPLTSAELDTLLQLESAVSLLLEQAVSLQSRNQGSLHNLLDYLRSSRQSLQKRAQLLMTTLPEPPPIIPVSFTPTQTTTPLRLQLAPQHPWKALIGGGIVGIAVTLCALQIVHWLGQPSTVSAFNQLWPDNFYSLSWQKSVAENAATLPTINSWALLNKQLDNLEQRLLDAEQKRKPYITISELKTAIYQMQQTLQQGGEPVLSQLDDLQNKVDKQQPVTSEEIEAIRQHIEALNSRLNQLASKK